MAADVNASPPAVAADAAGAREAEAFYRDDVYARFQALLEGREPVDLAGIQASLVPWPELTASRCN